MVVKRKKVAVITGASSGFGRAAAVKLMKHGWYVIILARRLKRIVALQNEFGVDNCYAMSFDVCSVEDIKSLVEFIDKQSISVDLLVNNAGLALGLNSADKADVNDWQCMIDTNCTGLVNVTRALLPAMIAVQKGHIINIGSIAGTYAYPGGNTYGATKAFVAQFSLNLRADLAGSGIRVTNIEPGLAETEFSLVRFHGDEKKAKSVYEDVQPLTAEDVAETIFWCASLPSHVNVNRLELMPTCQAFSPLSVTKSSTTEPL